MLPTRICWISVYRYVTGIYVSSGSGHLSVTVSWTTHGFVLLLPKLWPLAFSLLSGSEYWYSIQCEPVHCPCIAVRVLSCVLLSTSAACYCSHFSLSILELVAACSRSIKIINRNSFIPSFPSISFFSNFSQPFSSIFAVQFSLALALNIQSKSHSLTSNFVIDANAHRAAHAAMIFVSISHQEIPIAFWIN